MVIIGQHLPKQPGSPRSFQVVSGPAMLSPQPQREKSNKLAESVPSSKKSPSGSSSTNQKSPITIKENLNGPLSPPKAAVHMSPELAVLDLAGEGEWREEEEGGYAAACAPI